MSATPRLDYVSSATPVALSALLESVAPRGSDVPFIPDRCLSPGRSGMVPPIAAQLVADDWSDRPDAQAPAGVNEDALLAPGIFEARYSMELMSFEGLKAGTEEIPAVLVLRDWDLAPLSMTTQRHEVELRAGILDWLGGSVTVPFHHTSTELANNQTQGQSDRIGNRDLEVHALFGLHDTWPYRAHLIAGLSLPTGSVEEVGQLPTAEVGESEGHSTLSHAAGRRDLRTRSRGGLRRRKTSSARSVFGERLSFRLERMIEDGRRGTRSTHRGELVRRTDLDGLSIHGLGQRLGAAELPEGRRPDRIGYQR